MADPHHPSDTAAGDTLGVSRASAYCDWTWLTATLSENPSES
jgi:hypothetical protein